MMEYYPAVFVEVSHILCVYWFIETNQLQCLQYLNLEAFLIMDLSIRTLIFSHIGSNPIDCSFSGYSPIDIRFWRERTIRR